MPSHELALRHRNALLDRLLEQPDLADRIQALEPAALARAIQQVGLEDAGQLVALASSQQLARIFDEDLWVSEEVGEEDRFDPARFGLWLSVLLESGAALAARKLLQLDEDFLTMALTTQLLVIDIEAMAVEMSSDQRDQEADLLDKRLEGTLYHEFESYRVIAKQPEHWEALLAVLCEWNEQHAGDFVRLLERCSDLSSLYIEDNGGLYSVLSQAQSLAEDVRGERADRREAQGYVAPSDARAFLRLTLQRDEHAILSDTQLDPLTRAHFRARERAEQRAPRPAPGPVVGDAFDQTLQGLLAEQAPTSALRLPAGQQDARVVQDSMRLLRSAAPALYDQRALELAYLANVLLAAQPIDGRRMRPVEAFECALALCELGAWRAASLQRKRSVKPGVALLTELSLLQLFQLGFRFWHQQPKAARVTRHALLSRLTWRAWRGGASAS